MVHLAFSTALLAASIGLIAACAPPAYYGANTYAAQQPGVYGAQSYAPQAPVAPQTYSGGQSASQLAYIRRYQEMHRDTPCVQCQAIVAESECSSNWHNDQFGCSTPQVNYGLGPRQCGQASISCPSNGGQRSTMLVALLDNADGRFGSDARVWAPISDLQGAQASMTQMCDDQSQWLLRSLDNYRLAQPLTIQCAHNAPGFHLPPVSQRYQEFLHREERRVEPQNVRAPQPAVQQSGYEMPQQTSYVAPQQTSYVVPQQTQYVAPQQTYVQPQQTYEQPQEAARVLNEDVREEILGTTLIPVVKERVIQSVVKETHHYPIQKKRLIKTRRISKPVLSQREIVERVPATRIVPTFEEVRRVEKIHGTTIEPIVEAFEVTEMLPEIVTSPPVVEQRPAAVQSYEVQPMPSNAGVQPQQPSGYEQVQQVQSAPQPAAYEQVQQVQAAPKPY